MFGGFGAGATVQRMMREKREAENLPHRDVTRTEFIRLFMAAGGSGDEAKKHARLSSVMGAHTRIGNELVRVVKARRQPRKK